MGTFSPPVLLLHLLLTPTCFQCTVLTLVGVTMSDSGVWSFGYGANMDMVALQNKKKVKVLEHCPAILRGFKLAFSMRGPPYVEPGYGGLWREEGGEVHGVAFLMGEGGEAQLDRNEGPYLKEIVKLEAYDGRELEGYVYMTRNQNEEWLPSARYLGVLCKGARQAGLNPAYIEKLASHPVYRSEKHPEVMSARKTREAVRGSLRPVTREELREHRREDPWVSCLGFVIKCDAYLTRHKAQCVKPLILKDEVREKYLGNICTKNGWTEIFLFSSDFLNMT